MTEQQMPARIWVGRHTGWAAFEMRGDTAYVKVDLAERMAEALEAVLFEDSDKSEVDRIKDRVLARSALSAFRSATQNKEARHDNL